MGKGQALSGRLLSSSVVTNIDIRVEYCANELCADALYILAEVVGYIGPTKPNCWSQRWVRGESALCRSLLNNIVKFIE